MPKNLENYLEEISHFLSGREERHEILSEIRSHIMEKAEQEGGPVTEASLEKVISAYGQPRRVAEKYLENRPVIAPVFQRHLFRYASCLFAIHFAFTVFALIFKQSFVVFPFLFMPRLGLLDAVMYLPMAFLADFGVVALILYFITRSGKEIKLPWPKFALDLNEMKAFDKKNLAAKAATLFGGGVMLALTAVAIWLFVKFHTIFFVSFNFEKFRPLLLPEPGRRISLIVIAMLAAQTIAIFVSVFARSRRVVCWVDAATDALGLVLIGMLLRQPAAGLFAVHIAPASMPMIWFALTIGLLVVALMIAIDLVAKLVRLGRKSLKK